VRYCQNTLLHSAFSMILPTGYITMSQSQVSCTFTLGTLGLKYFYSSRNTLTLFPSLFFLLGTAPSLVDHQQNCTLPNPYPYNFENMTKSEQDHFENEERWRCFITSAAMNDTCTGRYKRCYVK